MKSEPQEVLVEVDSTSSRASGKVYWQKIICGTVESLQCGYVVRWNHEIGGGAAAVSPLWTAMEIDGK